MRMKKLFLQQNSSIGDFFLNETEPELFRFFGRK